MAEPDPQRRHYPNRNPEQGRTSAQVTFDGINASVTDRPHDEAAPDIPAVLPSTCRFASVSTANERINRIRILKLRRSIYHDCLTFALPI
jgi:hypothetical protein